MNGNNDDLSFEVLGIKIKFRLEEKGRISPDQAVNLVREEANKILSKSPNVGPDKIALLVALKMAYERLNIEDEYRSSIEKLHVTAGDALQYIEDASPPSS